jgi:hypothetical protein
MKTKLPLALLIVTCIVCLAAISRSHVNNEVAYPEGFRNWSHIKTTIGGPASPPSHSGFHHIYANEKAMEGYRTGKFPEGSILVFDVLETLQQPNGNINEGKRKLTDVMVKDSHKYDSTGGWGFEEFPENSVTQRNILTLVKQKCFNCHATRQNNDFVFSSLRK